jgi:hypothetical protein
VRAGATSGTRSRTRRHVVSGSCRSGTRSLRAASYDGAVGEERVTCSFCGRTAPAGEPPLTWTTSVEGGRRRRFCDVCSREHLRAIEGKLDSEHW